MKKAQFFYLLRRGFFAGGGGEWSTLVNAFKTRVIADGGTLESESCIRDDVKYLIQNPEPVAFTGLLNDYSGAAAAYSLRLLDNTYTGDAIVVRRASDNTTQSIGFVNNELDTTSLESFCSGTDGFVTTWHDQSGNGYDATQTTSSAQPKIVSSGSTILDNGKPAIEFDGVNDALRNANYTSNQPITYFNLRKYITNKTSIALSFNSASSLYADVITGGEFRVYFGSYLTYSISNTNQGLFYCLANIESSELKINNDGIITGNLGNRSANSIEIGYSSLDEFNANIYSQELIIYSFDNSSNRSGIETNINDFYTIY